MDLPERVIASLSTSSSSSIKARMTSSPPELMESLSFLSLSSLSLLLYSSSSLSLSCKDLYQLHLFLSVVFAALMDQGLQDLLEKPVPCDYLHLFVLRAFDVLVYSMVLEVLVTLWHSKLFQFGRIFTQIFPGIISIDFFLGFVALPLTLLFSLLLFELHHLKVLKVILK